MARALVVVLALSVANLAGCPATPSGPSDESAPLQGNDVRDAALPPGDAATDAANGNANGETVSVPASAEPAKHEPAEPTVLLSGEHRQTSVVFVGEVLPDFLLPDVQGTPHRRDDLLGEKLTVVVFWKANNPYAKGQYQRLQGDIAAPLEGEGIAVVAVAVGDTPEKVAEATPEPPTGVVSLIDAEGKYFAQVATDYLPRTYLLGAAGQILWMDINYSETTTHPQLLEAIRWYLAHPPESS